MKLQYKRSFALLLALLLAFSPLSPALAEENIVSIGSAAQLRDLAASCVSDTWSRGVRVVLTADIDLTGIDFSPIPVFQGTFDGGGHTIRGLSWAGRGSDMGLFRYLQAEAVVKNLNLEGWMAPGGSKCGVGLLAGRNEGLIESVAVSGTVEGQEDVGGLVGVNTETGVIRSCVSSAQVTGVTRTGGIAGSNHGLIDRCTNRGTVNDSDEPDAEHTGGIAGVNPGSIEGCLNYGQVGYPHAGYNVGGIAGLQDGSIAGCENYGSIRGRKDVGGIVGQLEPYTVLSYGEAPMQRLDDELSVLSGLMTRLANQVSDSAGSSADDLSAINGTLGDLRDTAHGAGTDFNTDTKASADQIYGAAQSINTALGSLLDELEDFRTKAGSDTDVILEQLTQLRKGFGSMGDALSWGADAACEALDSAKERITEGRKTITTHLDGISDDLSRLEHFLNEALSALSSGDLNGVRDAYDKWDIGSIDPGAHLSAISDALRDMGTCLNALWEQLDLILTSASDDAQAARTQVNRAAGKLETAMKQLQLHTDAFANTANTSLKTIHTQTDLIEDVLKAYGDTLSGKGQDRLDKLDGHLTDLGEQIDRLTQGAADANRDLHSTALDIIGQLDRVRSSLTGLMDTPEKTVEDLSGEEDYPMGRVVSSRNKGAVAADANVGGIAGTLSPELSLDPEQDLELDSEKLLVDTTAALHATLRGCVNRGGVTAKTGYAGGILGRGEVGAVLDCVSIAAVEATDGGQCGGIAGASRTLIRRCAAQSDLTGTDFLGGIAGQGHDIEDCVSMARSDSAGEGLGAIAGSADGSVCNNYFLDEGLSGVDSVNYEGKAMPLDLNSFSALELVPEEFLHLTVTFRVDGQEVAVRQVPYAGALHEDQIPPLPEREGQFGAWSEFDASRITRSLVVDGVYASPVRTISSGGSQPVLLAEGAFSPDAVLTAADHMGDLPGTDLGAEGGAWDYQITDQDLPETVTLRIRAEDPHQSVALLQSGALVPTEAVRDGSYLVFTAGASGTVVLVNHPGASPIVIALPCAAALAALLTVLVLRRRRKTAVPSA